MNDPRDLSGVWYGRYVDRHGGQNTSFIALFDEKGGHVSGTITEPADGAGGIRRATVLGTRNGASVGFVKQYHGRWTHAVHYSGAVSEHGLEANGTWQVDGLRGSFVMQREKFSAEELADEREDVLNLN